MVNHRFKCKENNCSHSFSRRWNLIRHEQRYHNNSLGESCLLCKKVFMENKKLQEHLILDHGPSEKFYLKESAFEEAVLKYRLIFDDTERNFNHAQVKVLNELKETIRYEAARKTVVKVSLVFVCQMSMQDLSDEKIHSTLIPFRSSSFVTNGLRKTGLANKLKHAFRQQENAMEEFCNSGSSWVFDRAVAYDIEISGIKPLVMGSGKKRIQNVKMKHKKFLFDPDNADEKCFLRCLHFLLKVNVRFGKWEKELDLDGIVFPISIPQIKKFVKQNTNLNIRINVLFRNLDKLVYPYECGIGIGSRIVNLLMIEKQPTLGTEIKIRRHFLGITDVNKYLARRYLNPRTSKFSYTESFYCLNCFNSFRLQTQLDEHERLCLTKKPIVEIVPDQEILKFKNHKNQHMQDFIAFLDFECLLTPGKDTKKCPECKSIRCKCDRSFTEIVNNQEPFAYSFVIVNARNKIIHERTYVGEDASSNFIDHLMLCWKNWIKELFSTNKPMRFTEIDAEHFENETRCYLCKRVFIDEAKKNRDHDHFTGTYLGAACTFCNLQRRRPFKLPIFLHNGSRYDFHFLIRALNNKDLGEIKILPYNGEHFRTIEFKGFRFLDSLAFLQASLDQLTEDLSKTDHKYQILKQTYLAKSGSNFDPLKFNILLTKSYYPYEYCTNFELMKNTTTLPKRSDFYSSLREKTIGKEEHRAAKKVWKMFNCQNLLDYTKLYCKLDTILLAEVFQKFRKDMHEFSSLDPSHYISLPAFAFDSMMKITGCKMDLLHDIDMIHFVESSIRGGVSFINTRFLEAKKTTAEEIVYIDANVSSLNN